ncbi:MAG: hypothetical protein ACOX3F_05035 [Kiritimatiellia bacterium]|jgi:hypothetical protein
MRRAIIAGWIVTGVVLLGFMARDGWAQDSWPEDPSDDAPFRPECGNPPPEMEDPSPGDGNDCWEYTESDGWAQLFECIEEIIECPAVDCEPVPGEGCACLLIGDSESFSFAMPSWTVEPGRKEIKPDNPDCGEAEEKEITPGADDSWVVTGGEGVVAVAPRSGSGDADFTVTAVAAGCAELVVTWRMSLSMEEDCQKEFTEEGPRVEVCVIEQTGSGTASKKTMSRTSTTISGDCEVTHMDYVTGQGLTSPPLIEITVTCVQRCDNDEQDCNKYSPNILIIMLEDPRIKVATRRRIGDCDRNPAAIARTEAHEQIHCSEYNKGFDAFKAAMEADNGKREVTDCAGCEDNARKLLEKAKEAWETAVNAASSHGNTNIVGTAHQCRFMDRQNPCATENCEDNQGQHQASSMPNPCVYNQSDVGGGMGGPVITWSKPKTDDDPCFEISQETIKR